MSHRINRAIELLEQDQPIYYVGGHTGHVLTRDQGAADAKTWADYINVGMEHGSFNMHGLDEYMQGLIDGGPTNSGHRTPPVIVEPPVDGSSEQTVRYNAWQFRQILARGVHGILLCMAETPDAVRAFVESCRYPANMIGEGRGLAMGTRGVGSEPSAAHVWGLDNAEYIRRADPWQPQSGRGAASRHQDRVSPRSPNHRADAFRTGHRIRRDGPRRPAHVVPDNAPARSIHRPENHRSSPKGQSGLRRQRSPIP